MSQDGREATLAAILAHRVFAILRLGVPDHLLRVAEALIEGGLEIIEISLATPSALDHLQSAQRRFGPPALFGIGTVLTDEQARRAMDAGARFVVTPNTNTAVVGACHQSPYDVAVIPGGLTPSEIQAAWEVGADMVKVFPASLGGPGYIRDVRAPLPDIRLVPTGGVTLENAREFLRAGAAAVAVGGAVVDPKSVASQDWKEIEARARSLVGRIAQT